MRYCGHFLIEAEGGAKNYQREHSLPLAWRSFTVAFKQRKGYIYQASATNSSGSVGKAERSVYLEFKRGF